MATKPQLGDALKLVIAGNHLGDEVAVIIDDWHLCRMIVIEFLCGLSLQQEILVHELFHCFFVLSF